MEVTPRYKPLVHCYTDYTVYSVCTAYTACTVKQLWSKKAIMPVHMMWPKCFMGFLAKCWTGWSR